jgi:membrane-associated phospholipid phosphatase
MSLAPTSGTSYIVFVLSRREHRWLLYLAGVAAVLGALSLAFVDRPLAAWVAARDTHPEAWNFALAFFEYGSGIEPWRWTGTVVLVVGTLITWYSPRWHRYAPAWLFVTVANFISVNLMMWGKHFSGRLRPAEWHRGDIWFSHGGSFPSGHISLVGSILIPLAVLFPRARLPALIFLAFVGCARIAVRAHWASDVFAGTVLVALVTYACAPILNTAAWPSKSK